MISLIKYRTQELEIPKFESSGFISVTCIFHFFNLIWLMMFEDLEPTYEELT